MGLDQPSHDGEPETGSTALFRSAIAVEEALEDTLAKLGWHAWTVVDDADRDQVRFFSCNGNRDCCARRREPIRVRQQVVEDLTKPIPICQHLDRRRIGLPDHFAFW